MSDRLILEFSLGHALVLLPAAFLMSLLLTRLMITLGPRLGLMDEPDERRVHVTPIPRAGGIAIWTILVSVFWMARWLAPDTFSEELGSQFFAFTMASAVLMVVGFIDDRNGMPALVKLGGQVLAAVLFFVLNDGLWCRSIFGFTPPWWLAAGIFVGWCVLLINAFNLIDGLDGLCSGLAVVSLVVMASLGLVNGQGNEVLLPLVLIAAILGFMRFNTHPARIFLGDAGSMMLGFFIASFGDALGGERLVVGSLVLPIALAGVPLLDVLLAVWRRGARATLSKKRGEAKGGGLFSPDRHHLHHRLLEMGLTQRRVATIMQGSAMIFAILCFAPVLMGGRGIVITLCGFLVLGLVGVRVFARVELQEMGALLHLTLKRRRRDGRRRIIYYIYDICALFLAGFLAMTIETNFGDRSANGMWSLNYLVTFVVIGVISLQLMRVYRRVWSRAGIREFFYVAVCLTLSALFTSSLWSIPNADVTWADFRGGFVGGQLACWLVLAPRLIPELVREFMIDGSHRHFTRNVGGKKQILVYGAGTRGNLFLELLKNSSPEEFKEFKVAGFLDRNLKLRRRSVSGYRVFGDLNAIEDLRQRYPLHGIMIAITQMSDEDREEVFEVALNHGLAVYEWSSSHLPQLIANPGENSSVCSPESAVIG
ncbi:MAG: hypothetical protein ABF391_11815 [Akkermansiaceae bacterium]